jgi:hypothetical protein
MARKILLLSVLAMALAAPSAYAQTAPASAVDPASIQALKDMGAYLLTLKRFGVSTEVTGERVLADGQKLQHTATADLDVVRPNKVRVLMKSARDVNVNVEGGGWDRDYHPGAAAAVVGTAAVVGAAASDAASSNCTTVYSGGVAVQQCP